MNFSKIFSVQTWMPTASLCLAVSFSASVFASANPVLDEQAKTFQAGLAAYQAEDFKQAREIWSELRAQPNLVPELQRALDNNLAVLLVEGKAVDDAIASIEQALRADPQVATALDNLNRLYAYKAQLAYKKVFAEASVPAPKTEVLYFNTETVVASTPNVLIAEPVASPAEKKAPVLAKVEQKSEQKAEQKAEEATLQKPIEITLVAEPTAKPVAKTEKNSVAEHAKLVKELTDKWRKAWAAQNLDDYLSYYHPSDFQPKGNDSIELWRKKRAGSLKRPSFIKVELDNVRIHKISDDEVRIRFLQKYHSDRFKDNINKELIWQKSELGWKIVKEKLLRAK